MPRSRVKKKKKAVHPGGQVDAQTKVRVREARMDRIVAARTDVNEFAVHIGKDARTGKRIVQEEIHETFQILADLHPRLILMAHPESGKAVPLDTPIPVPGGWTTMGALKVGDPVFDREGSVCEVTWTSPIQHKRTVYEIQFDDGGTARADADHRWIAKDARDRTRKGNRGRNTRTKVVTTADMAAEVRCSDRNRWMIPVGGPIQWPPRALPIAPYVLGAWLGDGHRGTSRISFHRKDRFVFDRCAELEGAHEPKPDKRNPDIWYGTIGRPEEGFRGAGAVRSRLSEIGVLVQKGIPRDYQTASVDQRMDLLSGLLDTDGSVDRKSGTVEFTTTSSRLADDVLELVRGLGFKATRTEGDAKINGRVVSKKFRVCFTPLVQVFRLPRKQRILRDARKRRGTSGRQQWRSVVSIHEIQSVPVRCITVDSPDATYRMGWDFTVTHNTTQLGIFRLLHRIGLNPNIRIAIVSTVEDNAVKISRALRSYIEKSEELAEVFPNLLPGDKWEENRWTVAGAAIGEKDYTVQALGIDGTIIGSRVDILVLDDILDAKNTATPTERAKVIRRLRSGFFDRLSGESSVIFLCNAWHPEDAVHVFDKEGGWHVAKFPIYGDDGEITWPAMWNQARLDDVREIMGPLEFARAFLCKARDEGESPFDEDAFKLVVATARTERIDLCYEVDWRFIQGCVIYTGVDLAVTKTSGSHLTALTTVLLWPEDMSRQLLWVRSGRWSSSEIRSQILDTDRRYGTDATEIQGGLEVVVAQARHFMVVENNAAQRWIIDIVRNQADLPEEERRVPNMIPFTTGRNKAHPQYGVEGLAVELATPGMWVWPETGPKVAVKEALELKSEALYYTRGKHTGDRLMSLWLAREGCRRGTKAGKKERPQETRGKLDPFAETPGVRIIEGPGDLEAPGINIFAS